MLSTLPMFKRLPLLLCLLWTGLVLTSLGPGSSAYALEASAKNASADNKTKTILVLGDSISAAFGINSNQGWAALLQQRLSQNNRNYRVVNASVSGDTTRTGLNRLDDALRQHRPAIVIVALGGNDGLRGLPFSEIESSLSAIIQRSQRQGAKVLIAGVRLPPNYGAFYNTRFATLFDKLAKKYKVALVPRLLEQVSDYAELMQADGIHPTAKAQSRIVNNVWPHLQPLL